MTLLLNVLDSASSWMAELASANAMRARFKLGKFKSCELDAMSSKVSSVKSPRIKFSTIRTTSSTCHRCANSSVCTAVFAVTSSELPPVYTSSMSRLLLRRGGVFSHQSHVEAWGGSASSSEQGQRRSSTSVPLEGSNPSRPAVSDSATASVHFLLSLQQTGFLDCPIKVEYCLWGGVNAVVVVWWL